MSSLRRAPNDPAARRRAWAELLAEAETVGARVAGGLPLSRDQAVSFAASVVHSGELAFPPPWASARSAAEGFRHLARGFIAAATPELKAGLGRAMAAAAVCCRQMMDLETESAAAEARRRNGEKDD